MESKYQVVYELMEAYKKPSIPMDGSAIVPAETFVNMAVTLQLANAYFAVEAQRKGEAGDIAMALLSHSMRAITDYKAWLLNREANPGVLPAA
jgi:hypothetical protein